MERLIEIPALDFDLAKTLDSGQVFHWEKLARDSSGRLVIVPFIWSNATKS